jgi:hypothetical protein
MSVEQDTRDLIALLQDGGKFEIKKLTIDELTRLQSKLALYRASLSEIVADAVFDANMAYIYRRFQRAEKFSALKAHVTVDEKKMTDGAADNKTEEMIYEFRKDEMEKRRQADRVEGLLDSVDKLMFVLHDRTMSLMAEERQAAKQEG